MTDLADVRSMCVPRPSSWIANADQPMSVATPTLGNELANLSFEIIRCASARNAMKAG
jgi:hypothetical protein